MNNEAKKQKIKCSNNYLHLRIDQDATHLFGNFFFLHIRDFVKDKKCCNVQKTQAKSNKIIIVLQK